jgi:hypothetical protein
MGGHLGAPSPEHPSAHGAVSGGAVPAGHHEAELPRSSAGREDMIMRTMIYATVAAVGLFGTGLHPR